MIVEGFVSFISRIMLFTAYVNNQSSFEKPLTKEDEEKYIKAFIDGDTSARDKLVKHNLRLVSHIVKKYKNAGEADDLISVGSIGLIKAINSYKPDKGTQLSTYAARCIENEILMLIRTSKKHRDVGSLSAPMGSDKDGNDITIADIVPADNQDLFETAANAEIKEKLHKIIKENLDERELKIITMRYGLGDSIVYTQREIAKALEISRSYISRIEKKAIDVIKAHINIEDFI
ncbi:MAG: RNA polymerase sporulation sigma factor SigK [Firmicutes bacterium]|nr:RNA polymerase sporulation sigma factor SigK [Bacillota bacterium]